MNHRFLNEDTLRWLAVGCAFSVALPTAWISVLSGLFGALYLVIGNFRERCLFVRTCPPAIASLVLIAWMSLAMSWSPAPWSDALRNLWKYRELILFPAIASVILKDESTADRWQSRLLLGFLAGFSIAFVTSWLRWLGLISDLGFKGAFAGFHGRTGYSLMLAFVTYLCVDRCFADKRRLPIWLVASLICLSNLFIVNDGRTGQLAFLLLIPWVTLRYLGARWSLVSIVSLPLILSVSVIAVPSNMDRFNASFEQWESFQEGKANAGDALRLTYWSRTIEDLKSDDLLIGRGTGSYRFVNGRSKHSLMHEALLPTDNPHNEFLMILSQQGLIGLGMLLVIGILQWRVSSLSPANMQLHVKGLLMVFGFGCLFNCMLLDNLEGHFYVLMVVAFGAVPRHYRAMSD